MPRYAAGLDFGTLSARALFVDVDTGETQTAEHTYRHGIIEDPSSPAVARQDANDYLEAVEDLLSQAPEGVIGIGVAATASTPIPVDADLRPLDGDLDAMAWLWKDHSAQAEAEEITALFAHHDPVRLARVGAYYAEWFWAKVLRCARNSPQASALAATWVEQCDFVTAHLTGNLRRGKCAAGHKALYCEGYPPTDTLANLHPELARIARTLAEAASSSETAGGLSAEWGAKTGVPSGTPVAVGGVDAHLGAVGAGIWAGRVCMVLGTSACHMAVAPYGIESVPGISGIADDSILPGMLGLEAGQAAFGDLFEWAAEQLGGSIEQLSADAARAKPGCNGMIVLDFHSGNRCPLADARLAGVVLGQSLKTTRAESFRAVVEAAAFGIRQILELLTVAGVPVTDLVACGGVAEKNDFVLQTIADVTGRNVYRSASGETVALGAAIFGAVVGGVFGSAEEGQSKLCKIDALPFTPSSEYNYTPIFEIWKQAQKELGRDSTIIKQLLDLP
ncbi:MAG: ribulokinase [Fimbriimonadales bacterium]